MEFTDEGVCRFCRKTFSGTAMGRHLAACPAKKEEDRNIPGAERAQDSIYHLRITASRYYWLHIEIDAGSSLDLLDGFLRNIWLECCGHLSEFTIGGEHYSSGPPLDTMLPWMEMMESGSMEEPINQVLQVKDTFDYCYDFGSTTRLRGKVFASRRGAIPEPVRLLARNNPYKFPCSECGKPATEICLECNEFFCERCSSKHDGDYLPVVNSPRMGVCAYTGQGDPDDFPDG
jgi:hypothetical protein